MSNSKKTNRREFIQGKSALEVGKNVLRDSLREELPAFGESHASKTNSALVGGLGTHLLSFSQNAMGCSFEFIFNQGEYTNAGEMAAEMFDLVNNLESQLSIYDPESEVSKLNSSPPGTRVAVSQSVFECFRLAKEISETTQGAFDITSGPLTEAWGFEARKPTMPKKAIVERAKERVDYRRVNLHREDCSISISKSGTKINLGGIGKGFALDACVDFARNAGVENLLIHGGQSSVFAIGNHQKMNESNSKGWNVGLTHPIYSQQRLAEIGLENRSLGTSGSGRQAFFHEGRKLGHILDPRTGWPAEQALSATVISDSAARSDALATAFCVLDLSDIEAYCREHQQVQSIVAYEQQGRIAFATFNLESKFLGNLMSPTSNGLGR